MGTVCVVGAVNVDLVVVAPRLPGPGETVVGAGVRRFGGGKGANAAVAAARAGATVALVGAVGADDTGAAALDELRGEGVGVTGVAVHDGVATGVALIVVDEAGENQIAVGAGANGVLAPDDVTGALDAVLGDAGCVLVSTEISGAAVVAAVRAATAARIACLLNPAPVIDAVAELLGSGAILTPNRSECLELAASFSDASGPGGPGLDAVRAAAAWLGRRSGAPVVVTLGGDGALVVGPGGEVEHVAAPAVPVRDTTGAGDTFNGVLAARLAAGDGLVAAVRTAVVAASRSVGHAGARGGMPTAGEIAAAENAVGETGPA